MINKTSYRLLWDPRNQILFDDWLYKSHFATKCFEDFWKKKKNRVWFEKISISKQQKDGNFMPQFRQTFPIKDKLIFSEKKS